MAGALGLQLFVYGEDNRPWFGNDNEFEWKTSQSYQAYKQMDAQSLAVPKRSHSHYTDMSLGVATMGKYYGALSVRLADTDFRDFGVESFSFTASKLLMNDLVGDPYSLSVGAQTTITPTSESLNDPSSLRHSYLEAKVLASIGREKSREWTWSYRYWASLSLGGGNKGSPWAELFLAFEKNFWDQHCMRLSLDSRKGFGSQDLVQPAVFTGYRELDYHLADLAASYSYKFAYWGSLTIQGKSRVEARYVPKRAHMMTLSYNLPFSL